MLYFGIRLICLGYLLCPKSELCLLINNNNYIYIYIYTYPFKHYTIDYASSCRTHSIQIREMAYEARARTIQLRRSSIQYSYSQLAV